jgi:hypothetical protein
MNSLEQLVEVIESHSPSHIKILAPVFNPSFLWKLLKDIGIYKRKNLENLSIYVLNFSRGTFNKFFLNECIEIQELFPKINIYKLNSINLRDPIRMAPGVILIGNGEQKAYSYETEFSSSGFELPAVLSGIPLSKALTYFDESIGDSSTRILRENLPLIFESSNLQEDLESNFIYEPIAFELSFISSKTNKIHNAGAGLNWGRRTLSKGRKDLNAAYIHIPKSLQKCSQIPKIGELFSCQFDDGVEFDLVRTGEGGKNLTSAYENQILGRYIRSRLCVAPGQLIRDFDLECKNIFGVAFTPIKNKSFFARFVSSKLSKVY